MTAPTPVSEERVRQLLVREEVPFAEFQGDAFTLPTPNAIYFFDASSEHFLQMRAMWRGVSEEDSSFEKLVNAVAECNATRTGPKAYLAPMEAGDEGQHRYGLMAESNVVTMAGLTDEQLTNFMETSMSMILSLFVDVEAAIPELVTWTEED